MARPPAAAKQFNKVAIRVAGRRALPLWVVLRHQGRKSGREFATPLAALTTDDAFVIALPWGRGTDWVRNVRAAGGCTVVWKGRAYVCTEPEFIDRAAAMEAAGRVARRILGRVDPAGGYLRLKRSPVG